MNFNQNSDILEPINIELRSYQKKVISDLYGEIRKGEKKILLFAPTGAGKTIIASRVIFDASSKNRPVLMVVHRDILVKQTANKLNQLGLNFGLIKAGFPEQRNALIQIASIQTMESRGWWRDLPIDLIILDEAHLTSFTGVAREMLTTTHPNSIFLGLTATPYRLSKTEGMGDIFSSLVLAPLPHQLIDMGFLVKPSYYGLDLGDFEKVKVGRDGDFKQSDLAIAVDQPELINQMVAEWKRVAFGRRTIVFAVSVEHSQHLCQAFRDLGIPAAHVDGKTSEKECDRIYGDLARGQILVLCSCMKLTEGFDVPAVNCIVLARATKSKALSLQMIGRGLRLSPETDKVDCVVLDFVGNVKRFGFVEDLKEIRLTKGGEKEEAFPTPTKICPQNDGGCGGIINAFQMNCPFCGYHFEAKKLQITLKLKQRLRPEDFERIKFYRDKLKEAFSNKYSPVWAANRFRDSYGHFPPLDWAKKALFDAPTPFHQDSYRRHLQAIALRSQKDKAWVEKYFNLEFSE